MAVYVGFEGINNDVAKVNQRLLQNAQNGILSGSFAPNTINRMVNTGLKHPDRDARYPYVGPDNKELMAASDPPVTPPAEPLWDPMDEETTGGDVEDPEPGTEGPAPDSPYYQGMVDSPKTIIQGDNTIVIVPTVVPVVPVPAP
jgi:hypothetical protein